MITFHREQTVAFVREALPLFTDHHKELTHYKDFQLSVDFEQYVEFEKRGASRIFTVRKDTQLVGYAVFAISVHTHYAKNHAQCTVLYLIPALRGTGLGKQFILWCDDQLRLEFVHVVYHHVKASNDFSALLENAGYELVDYIYARRLLK